MVEQWSSKSFVAGSSPVSPAIFVLINVVNSNIEENRWDSLFLLKRGSYMNYLISFVPIILPLILILVFKLNSAKTMTITLITFVVGTIFFMNLSFNEIFAKSLNGMFNLLTPMFILTGAIMLLNILEYSGALNNIKHSFNSISPDQRIQVIIVAFLFSALIEGISGFGTPATIAAPILISLGFKPIQSIIIALMCNSFPVSFGATGIPISFGLFEPLEHNKVFNQLSSNLHMSYHEVFYKVCNNMIFLNYVVIPLLLLIVTFLVTNVFIDKSKRDIKRFYEMLPLIIIVSIVYPSVEFIVLNYISYSFVSIIAPIITLLVVFLFSKNRTKFVIPKKVFHEYFGDKNEITNQTKRFTKKLTLLKSWTPYFLVIVMLLFVRVIPSVKLFIQSFVIEYGKTKFQFLFNPGFTFILVSFFAFKFFNFNTKETMKIFRRTYGKVSGSFLVLLPTFILIEIFMNAHYTKLLTPAISMSNFLSSSVGNIWTYVSPFLGLIGSFINGSATVSNISFGLVHLNIAKTYNLDMISLLTLQSFGANMGNMICISNIIVVCSIVGVKNKESQILKYTMLVASILIIFAIILVNISKLL